MISHTLEKYRIDSYTIITNDLCRFSAILKPKSKVHETLCILVSLANNTSV